MSDLIVLMYHALYADAHELEAIDAEDRPYAVHVGQFEAHLRALKAADVEVISLAAVARSARGGRRRVLLTFDDGHASARRHALPALHRQAMSAVFFVTTDFIGRRAGFCGWDDLRALHAGGMAIQSHGASHRFFDSMNEQAATAEFEGSKRAIEAEIGSAVTAISFPGGRYSQSSLAQGANAGFTQFYSSIPGINAEVSGTHSTVLKRFAIRSGTTTQTVDSIVHARPWTIGRIVASAHLKSAVRRALGNRLYHWAYRRGAA